MSFRASAEAFNSVFGETTGAAPVPEMETPHDTSTETSGGTRMQEFLDGLLNYLDDRGRESDRLMADAIRNKEPISSFLCRLDVMEDMSRALYENGIPSILVDDEHGNRGYLIRKKDTKKVRKIQEDVRMEASRYCHVVTPSRLTQEITYGKDKDREVLSLCGLTREEMQYLKGRCDRLLPSSMAAFEKRKDGSYSLLCHAKTAVKYENRRGRNLCRTYAEAMLRLHGPDKEYHGDMIDSRVDYEKAFKNGFGIENGNGVFPAWIVGEGDQFLKLTDSDVIFGNAVNTDDAVELRESVHLDPYMPDFEQRFQSYRNRILHQILLYDEEEVIEYFRNDRKSRKRKERMRGEAQFLNQADTFIDRRMNNRMSIGHADKMWDEKFRRYEKDMAALMKGALEGKVPDGYSKEEVRALQKTAIKYGLNLSRYQESIKKIENVEVYSQAPAVERVRDFDAMVERMDGTAMEKSRSTERDREEEKER